MQYTAEYPQHTTVTVNYFGRLRTQPLHRCCTEAARAQQNSYSVSHYASL